MIASAEIGPDGEVRFSRPLGDQRFLEPYSGLYWQVTAPEAEPFRSRSLWDRAINTDEAPVSEELYAHDTYEFPQEPLRVLQRSEEHTSELQSLMRISYAVFCLKKKKTHPPTTPYR